MREMGDHMQQLEGLRVAIEHIMMQHTTPFSLVVDCEKCGHRTAHPIGRPNAINELAVLMAKEANTAKMLLISHMYSAIMMDQQHDTSLLVLIKAWDIFSKSVNTSYKKDDEAANSKDGD